MKKIASFIYYSCLIAATIIIITTNIYRFMLLEQSPPGFHVDELAAGVTVQCLATEGIDATGNRYPFFAQLNYGSPKPPTYTYPAILWTKIFGFSISSFRGFSAFTTLLAILGLFFIGRLLFHWKMGLLTALAASVSPWAFQTSRLAFESFHAPCMIVWGIYFFLRSNKPLNALITGFLFSCAMYSYPPTRLHLPLLFFVLLFLKAKKDKWNWKFILTTLGIWIVATIPLIERVLSGEVMGRFNKIGIFSQDYLASIGKTNSLIDIIQIFAANFLVHFNPTFLFLEGDQNYVYSTRNFGLFGWLEITALGFGIGLLIFWLLGVLKKKIALDSCQGTFILFCILSYLLGIIPSALTWQAIPHSLRIIGSWPFLILLVGYILFVLTNKIKVLWLLPVSVALLFLTQYFPIYFKEYPKAAYFMFGGFTKDQALGAKSDKDWYKFVYFYRNKNFELRYYLMNYGRNQTCSSTYDVWKHMYIMDKK